MAKTNKFLNIGSEFIEDYYEKNINYYDCIKEFCIGLKVLGINVSLINFSETGSVKIFHVVISCIGDLSTNSNILRIYIAGNKMSIKNSVYARDSFEILINNEEELYVALKNLLKNNWVKKEIKRIGTSSIL